MRWEKCQTAHFQISRFSSYVTRFLDPVGGVNAAGYRYCTALTLAAAHFSSVDVPLRPFSSHSEPRALLFSLFGRSLSLLFGSGLSLREVEPHVCRSNAGLSSLVYYCFYMQVLSPSCLPLRTARCLRVLLYLYAPWFLSSSCFPLLFGMGAHSLLCLFAFWEGLGRRC